MPESQSHQIHHGTASFRRTNLALFAAGFCNFSLLYSVQPLLPAFSRTYAVSPSMASLSLSLTTGVLAVAMIVCGAVSDSWGRKAIMVFSLMLSSLLTVAVGFAPGWRTVLAIRALMGVSLSGVPSIAMAYLSEEMDFDSIGLAMGLFIGGSAVGGMSGRLLTSVFTDWVGWHWALVMLGALDLVAATIFWQSLPKSRHFSRTPLDARSLLRTFRYLFNDQGLPWLFMEGFLLMGAFVTVYNYIGYRLMAPPYRLSQSAVGLIFIVYLVGIFSSTWMGHVATRIGRRKLFWCTFIVTGSGIAMTLLRPLPLVILGIAIITFGFFAGHSIAASWIGRRAKHSKAQASSLYLFSYYMGSSIAGATGGIFWSRFGWHGIASFTGIITFLGLLLALMLSRLAPLPAAHQT